MAAGAAIGALLAGCALPQLGQKAALSVTFAPAVAAESHNTLPGKAGWMRLAGTGRPHNPMFLRQRLDGKDIRPACSAMPLAYR